MRSSPPYASVARWASGTKSSPLSDAPVTRDMSYSSVALRHSQPSSPSLPPSLSLPPLRAPARPPPHRTHSLHGGANENENENETQAAVANVHTTQTLNRSDSLLQKARRVFSLPAAARRRTRDFAQEASVACTQEEATPRVSVPFPDTHDRVRALENELELERIRSSRARRRLRELESQTISCRHAIPAVETIVKAALAQFEAKERALAHTMAEMERQYEVLLAEKNEAVRLLNAFVGRGGRTRSPPPCSFSSVSEASENVKDKKASGLETVRRTNVVELSERSEL